MKVLEHILLFKFKNEKLTQDEFNNISNCIENIKCISGVLKVQFGENISNEPFVNGYNYYYRVLFESEQSLKDYFPHPHHESLKKEIFKVVDSAVVADFFIENN